MEIIIGLIILVIILKGIGSSINSSFDQLTGRDLQKEHIKIMKEMNERDKKR